ncbi:MAG: hypothetical protein KA154_10380 [Gemmatimonadaceae bacterium]|nr:hypothetical protein [Gemmatimonadaceae bacterium]
MKTSLQRLFAARRVTFQTLREVRARYVTVALPSEVVALLGATILLAALANTLSAQVCLGRPAAADARIIAAIDVAKRDGRVSTVPQVGVRMGPAFAMVGAGTQFDAPRAAEFHAHIGIARAESIESRVSICPVLRLMYRSGYRVADANIVQGADSTIEIGISIARRFGNTHRLTLRSDAGIEHHLGRRTTGSPIDGDVVNHLVAGVGVSARLNSRLTADVSVRAFAEGSIEPRYVVGLVMGWP